MNCPFLKEEKGKHGKRIDKISGTKYASGSKDFFPEALVTQIECIDKIRKSDTYRSHWTKRRTFRSKLKDKMSKWIKWRNPQIFLKPLYGVSCSNLNEIFLFYNLMSNNMSFVVSNQQTKFKEWYYILTCSSTAILQMLCFLVFFWFVEFIYTRIYCLDIPYLPTIWHSRI